jgi:hypothetical protein
MEAATPQGDESPEAAEGTAAHWVVEYLAKHGEPPELGALAPNGVPIDQGMIDGAMLFIGYVAEVIGPGFVEALLVEQRVSMRALIHAGCYGTPDLRMRPPWVTEQGVQHIFDYKYGHGYVEVYENWQLVEYHAGAAEELGDAWHGTHTYVSHIVQPREYGPEGPCRSWTARKAQMVALWERAAAFEAASAAPDATTTVTPEGCRDCTARARCMTLQRAGGYSMVFAGGNTPHDPPPQAVGQELREIDRALSLLKARRTGLETVAMAQIRGGKRVPFFQVESTKARERWKLPAREVVAVGELFGANLAKPDAVMTPEQARKAGVDGSVISQYSERPPGELKLVPENLLKSRKVFGK